MKLSGRYPWFAEENRLTRLLREREAAGLPLRDLSISNPTRAEIELPVDLAMRNYEPSVKGANPAREAISRYYRESFGATISPDRIQLCASTSEGYSYCFKLLGDPGDEVLIPQPSYPLLEHLVRAEGLKAIPYPTHYAAGQWILDRDRLSSLMGVRTKAVVLVHPNNPTGHFWSEEDVAWLIETTPQGMALISDEVFADYDWGFHTGPKTLAGKPAFCLSGLSKICALPQMKLGWIVMPEMPGIAKAMEFVADTYLSVSGPIQVATPAWLDARAEFQAPIRARCQENLDLLYSQRDVGVDPVQAGWCAILRTQKNQDEEETAAKWIEHGFWAQPGFYYDLPFRDAFVVSLLTPPGDLAAGLDALKSF